MQYRPFGKLDWQVSALGFGCMRLPTIGGDPAQIDEPEATRMIYYAIDHGVNYIDTAYPYHGGNSERFLGKILQGTYRERVRLATKLPCWLVHEPQDFDRLLNEQLQKLQTDHIDFYLLHALNRERWESMHTLGVLEWAERARADGRIGHLGFSFHDDSDAFQTIVDAYDGWTFCQIQYNYVDIENQAGLRGLRYAASKGLAVVIMEPLRGGGLANPPEVIQAIWDKAPRKRTPVDWALQWLWNQPEVSVVLSGMSTMQQVVENVESASNSGVGTLTEEELALFDRVRSAYESLRPIPCTGCEYCLPCPNGINIPRLFTMFNDGKAYGTIGASRWQYMNQVPEDQRANVCVQCRQCEELCPQQIPISEWMVCVHEVLGEGKNYEECTFPA